MDFLIKQYDKEKDSENFLKLSFETLVSIKGTPPGTSRKEFYELAKDWVEGYIEELELNTIFIAEDEHENYAGHIWISLQDHLKPWEFEQYFWIQNISVQKNFRKQGLGTKLMKYAENWIKKQKGNNIGLHVNSESKDALRLYKKLDYTEYQSQFIKKLNNSSQKNTIKGKHSGSNNIIKISINEELDSIKNIIFKSFELKLRNKAPEERIQTKFDKYIDHLKYNQEDYHFFKVFNEKEQICGFFIVSISEWRYNNCAWIKDIGFIDHPNEKQFFTDAYGFLEGWVQNQEISFIEIVLSKNQTSLMNSCNEINFEIFGYFMEKKLN